MRVSDFDFDLPAELIAQEPRPRGQSRVLMVDRGSRSFREIVWADVPGFFARGDVIVVNDTKVFPARLLGRRDPSGGAVECLLLERAGGDEWHALVHPGQKLKPGARMIFEDPARAPGVVITGEILEQRFFGRRRVRLAQSGAADLDRAVDAIGHVPLPPYIARADTADDRDRYQTIFARARGSVAAPTAGLHFDEAMMAAFDRAGIERAAITHHVGYGTFQPVRVDDVEAHRVEPEHYDIRVAAARTIDAALAREARIVAVGTTTTRALESAGAGGLIHPGAGVTDLFIYPGHRFRVVSALVTNFHLPRSSLLMLVAAFAGRELVLEAYRAAIADGFRFYSYGDAMLIL
jgi:S-adenosylmethionine:tRNA ribosyltransferase-isomerase